METDKSTEVVVPGEDTVIIGVIHADWCGHCQSLKPEWAKMEKILSKDPKFVFMAIESAQTDKIKQAKEKLGVEHSGFPTIFKYTNGKHQYYNEPGPRLAGSLIKWANNPIKGPVMGGRRRLSKTHRRNKNTRRLRKTARFWFW